MKDVEDFYENKHINSDLPTVNFTNLSDEEFYRCLLEPNTNLLTHYFRNKLNDSHVQTKKLYLEKDASFRSCRHT